MAPSEPISAQVYMARSTETQSSVGQSEDRIEDQLPKELACGERSKNFFTKYPTLSDQHKLNN